MRISIRIDSAAGNAQLRRWGGEFRTKVQKAVERAIRTEAAEIKDDVRAHVAGQMSVVRKSFLKGFTAKVLAKDPNRLPALYVGSRIPWSGMHETGGQIGGRMLIPLHGRVGRKRFRAQVAELMQQRGADLGHQLVARGDGAGEVLAIEDDGAGLARIGRGIAEAALAEGAKVAMFVPRAMTAILSVASGHVSAIRRAVYFELAMTTSPIAMTEL